MKTLRQFREDSSSGLADVKPTSDVSGPEGELLNDLAELLRQNADSFKRILRQCLNSSHPPRLHSNDDENNIKKLIGIIGHLKESPRENKDKMRDPLDNVVVRPMNGPDGPGAGINSGGDS